MHKLSNNKEKYSFRLYTVLWYVSKVSTLRSRSQSNKKSKSIKKRPSSKGKMQSYENMSKLITNLFVRTRDFSTNFPKKVIVFYTFIVLELNSLGTGLKKNKILFDNIRFLFSPKKNM